MEFLIKLIVVVLFSLLFALVPTLILVIAYMMTFYWFIGADMLRLLIPQVYSVSTIALTAVILYRMD